jgi:hypothetical protein
MSLEGSRYAAGVEYDGSQFHGWQYQCGQSSVQEVVESALSFVADHPIRVIAAGRTDTGVHGIGQVIHFDSAQSRSLRAWLRGTNTRLPTGVTLSWVQPVDVEFHARYSAIARSYRYVLCNRTVPPTYLSRLVTWDHRAFNLTRMRSAAQTVRLPVRPIVQFVNCVGSTFINSMVGSGLICWPMGFFNGWCAISWVFCLPSARAIKRWAGPSLFSKAETALREG